MKAKPGANCGQIAAELMGGAAVDAAPSVDLLDDEPLEIELAATLLYEHSHYPYRQIRARGRSPLGEPDARKSSTLACAIVAAMTKCCAPSAPGSSSASTS